MLISFAFFSAALGYGNLILSRLSISAEPYEKLVLKFLVGSGVIATANFLVGLIFYHAVIQTAILLPGAFAFLFFSESISEMRNSLRLDWLTGTVAAFFLFWIISSMAPLHGSFFHDGIGYHLLGPKQWFIHKRIVPILDEPRTAFPGLIETLYGIGIAWGTSIPARLIEVMFGIGLVSLVYGFVQRLGLAPSSAKFGLLIVSVPTLWKYVGIGMVDVANATYILAFLRILFCATTRDECILVGLLAGFAMSTKYLSIHLILTAILVIIVLRFGPKNNSQPSISNLILSGIVALFTCLPWYLKNWIIYGSPIYPPVPLITNSFEVLGYTSATAARVKETFEHWGAGMGSTFNDLLLLPFRLTFYPHYFPPSGVGGIGIIPLAFVPFGVRSLSRTNLGMAILLWTALTLVEWFYLGQDVRYLIPVTLGLFLISAVGIERLLTHPSSGRRAIVAVVIGISILMGVTCLVRFKWQDLSLVLSKNRLNSYFRKVSSFPDSFSYLNNTNSVTTVMVFHPYVPTYYLDKEYIKVHGVLWVEPLEALKTSKDGIKQAKQLGVTHILDVKFDESATQSNAFLIPMDDKLENRGDFEIRETQGLDLVFSEQNGENEARIYKIKD